MNIVVATRAVFDVIKKSECGKFMFSLANGKLNIFKLEMETVTSYLSLVFINFQLKLDTTIGECQQAVISSSRCEEYHRI